MKKFKILVCSTIKILHDLSLDRRESGQFLSIKNLIKFVRKDYLIKKFLLIIN